MVKIIIGIIIAVLLIIFMIQNIASVEITFLAWTIIVSRVILVLVVLIFGIFLGIFVTEITWIKKNIKTRKKEKQKQEKEQQKQEKEKEQEEPENRESGE
ncbi:MAG: LapA family protein [Spirochaetales bacterium]|nr:LapA family protein [Spirochaetales bacterium]